MIIIDQLNRKIVLKSPAIRIISIVPSQTELLYDLGLREKVIGITKFCIHTDEWFRTKTRVGGTKRLDIKKIRSLNPDLIIGNKEENDQSQIEELEKNLPVWMSDIKTLADAKRMVISLGDITGKYFEAIKLLNQIDKKFDSIQLENTERPTVIYLIWNKPMMAAGSDTFINEMLKKSGFINIINQTRYPEIDANIINQLKPDYLFLSSEPFPFKEKHVEEYQKLFPFSKPVLVDGEMFSWYGSRLLKSADYFKELRSKI